MHFQITKQLSLYWDHSVYRIPKFQEDLIALLTSTILSFKETCSQNSYPSLRNRLFTWGISSHIKVFFLYLQTVHALCVWFCFSRGLSRLHATKIKQSYCCLIFKKWLLMLMIIFSAHLKFKIVPSNPSRTIRSDFFMSIWLDLIS